MSSTNTLRKFLGWSALGGLVGLGFSGCVINASVVDCNQCNEASVCHSQLGPDGPDADNEPDCYCEAGYEWSSPNDPNDFDCDSIPGKGGGSDCVEPNSSMEGSQCFCDAGYNWCNPADLDDLTCCEDPDQIETIGGTEDPSGGSTSDTGDTGTTDPDTGTTTGGTGEPDPADCDADAEGGFACNNDDATDPDGSRLWVCEGGVWVEQSFADYDESQCQFDGFDFAAGCANDADDPEGVAFLCEDGPGTDCTNADSQCADDMNLQFCTNGRLGAADCFELCTVDGDEEGITYDHGECRDEGGELFCFCCDSGDEDCPV